MNYLRHLSLAMILLSPQLLIAAEQPEHQYPPKDQIVWSPSAEIAFDRTGQHVTRRTLADGSATNEFHGSMQSVTVARLGPDGKVEMSEETYRVVGDTLIVNKPGYLINAKYRITGDEMIVSAQDFSAVLKRLR